MKLVAILRIKDEILYIERCLKRLSELVDEIIVLDNGSTDGTLDVYPFFSKIVQIIKTEGFDEGRDKIMLLEAAKKQNPDWIMWIDGDEEFEEALDRSVLEKYMNSKYNKILFRMCNFWLSEKYFRIDDKYFGYTLHPQRSMWRNDESAYFRDRSIHNGDIYGVSKPHFISPYRIKHYGYVNADKMRKKYNLYTQVDVSKTRSYEHLNPDAKTVRIPYWSFKNVFLNRIYIELYKIVISITHLIYRGFKKIF